MEVCADVLMMIVDDGLCDLAHVEDAVDHETTKSEALPDDTLVKSYQASDAALTDHFANIRIGAT